MLSDNNISQVVNNSAKTSVSSLPTSAFPIDARTYFESYDDALEAAHSAKQQVSTHTIYYYGMTLVVFEDNEVSEYLIVRDKSANDTERGTLILKFTEKYVLDGGTAADTDSSN